VAQTTNEYLSTNEQTRKFGIVLVEKPVW